MDIVCIDMYDEHEEKMHHYGLPSKYIKSILSRPEMEKIEDLHVVYGVTIKNNIMTPIVSLKQYLGIGIQHSVDNVIELEHKGFVIGVMIDKLDSVMSIDTDSENIDIKESEKEKFMGIAKYKDGYLNVIDVENIFLTLELSDENITMLKEKVDG